MNLREAAQQALEALENPWSAGPKGVADAITALRSALAEDRSADAGKTSDHFPDATKMVGPVAVWELQETGWEIICDGDLVKDLPMGIKLYTAPPKRKREPLTDKDVERLVYENTKINPNVADDREILDYIVNAVRAIERAHGIGGDE